MGANIVIEDDKGQRLRINPARDVAHYWAQLAAHAMVRLEDEALWPKALVPHLKAAGITAADMVRAGQRLEKAMRIAMRSGPEKPVDALEAAGFLRCHPLVQQAIMARIGQVSLGAWWDGVKDASVEGTVPASHADLLQAGMALAAALNEKYDPELPPPPPEPAA